jgi:hypothetical protein
MSRFRWLRPMKCIETMEFFPSLIGMEHQELERQLRDAVARGDVKAMLNDVVVPKAHIAIYLSLIARAGPKDGAHALPPDLSLNYDDLRAVFDRPVIDARKRGRPTRESNGWSQDRKLTFEMHRMLAGAPGVPHASSAAQAARMLVEAGKVPGAGTSESRAKRLVRKFREHHSS